MRTSSSIFRIPRAGASGFSGKRVALGRWNSLDWYCLHAAASGWVTLDARREKAGSESPLERPNLPTMCLEQRTVVPGIAIIS